MADHAKPLRIAPAVVLLALQLACAGGAPPAPTVEVEGEAGAGRTFLGERAYEDVRRQVGIGPRVTGTPGAAAARSYFRTELEKLGIQVDETRVSGMGVVLDKEPAEVEGDAPASAEGAEPASAEGAEPASAEGAEPGSAEGAEPVHPGFVHVRGVIPGTERSDVMLLAAAYDTVPEEDFDNVAANGSASGPAVVLELARAISAHPLPYETWVVLLDGDGGGASGGSRPGSRGWAFSLREAGELDRIRLAFFFRQVCDPDLRFERDLFSHRVYREAVWRAARRLGRVDAFPADAGYTTPAGSHISFLEVGVRRVVAFVDDAYGGTEAPGVWAGTADDSLDHCTAESLGVTGEVALATLDDLAAMLLKVDRLAGPPDELPAPGAEESVEQPQMEPSSVEQPQMEPSSVEPGPDSGEVDPAADPGTVEPSAEVPVGEGAE